MHGFDFKFCPSCGGSNLRHAFPVAINNELTSKECQDCGAVCSVSAQQGVQWTCAESHDKQHHFAGTGFCLYCRIAYGASH